MGTDRKLLYALSGLSLTTLLCVLFFAGSSRGVAAAILLLPLAGAICFFVKKRSIPSLHRHQVLLLMSVIGLLYLMLYYLSGLHFGFLKTGYKLNLHFTLNFILPITVTIITTEVIRSVVRSQNSRLADVLIYATCVCAQVAIQFSSGGVHTFNQFMDLMALAVFPAIVSNLLFHYLAKRFGPYPNIVFRLLTTLYIYVIPYKSGIPDSLLAFANLTIPPAIYFFLDALYEKKKRYALGKKSRFGFLFTLFTVLIMTATIMLISNQFRFGALVIATDSMTGELNKGDVAIFERCDHDQVVAGQVVVFEKDDNAVVHRLVDIKRINGQLRFFTKGDANQELDTGYVTQEQLIGAVHWKVPYLGYPTLWLRSLFNQ